MTKKKLFRFSKAVTLICLGANAAITVCIIVLLFRQVSVDAMLAGAMYAPFSMELFFNAMIKIIDKKGQKNEAE